MPSSQDNDPNLLSLSQIRYFGACPYGVASRRCCATQASEGDRVTPTWITRRVLSEGVEEGKERPKEKVSHQKARHRPRCSLRDCGETCSTFAHVAAGCELLACTSGWCACRPSGPVSTILHEYAQHRRRRFSLAICLIKAIVSAATLGI